MSFWSDPRGVRVAAATTPWRTVHGEGCCLFCVLSGNTAVLGVRPWAVRLCQMNGYLSSYATLGLLLVLGAFVFVAAFTANKLLSPATPASPPGKRDSYECGL